ncbi:MAG: N-6 DNA methylase [Planctomycetia bacterium]|nr:N-6 DNA methylase [Planctomycetia bacterium]
MGSRFLEHYVEAFDAAERLIGAESRLRNPKQLRLFTQALVNRLLFVRFVELKGWLEFQGRADYLQAVFAAGGMRGRSVYRSRIIPLFRALSERGSHRPESIGHVPLRIGGPFDETEIDRRVSDVPDSALALLLSDAGLFYSTRFTIDESSVAGDGSAVDPEILGIMFEELVTGRNESGAFYTPKPVVSFMCREALKDYLGRTTSVPARMTEEIVDHRVATEFEPAAAREIEAALGVLQAVDPACGSGAYLVGLLHELVGLYELLSSSKLVSHRPRDQLKRRIIETSLCGVDVDPLAVHIARLRLWLSLAVDAKTPCELPHLDRRIAVGDALMGRFPAALPERGFDVVLANPPYVRQELIGRARKRRLQKCFATAVDGKSDLYCYFLARGLELLHDGGVQVCISSGSWLDVAFGVKLQRYLLSHGRVVAVYDSLVERQFASAAINTVVSVIRKQAPEAASTTRFVTFRAPLETALQDPSARRELIVLSDELWNPPGNAPAEVNGCPAYRGGKWSGRYLRAPDSFLSLMRDPSRLKRLDDSEIWSIGRGRRTGCDDFFYLTAGEARERKVERRFLKPLVKSPLQFQRRPPRTSGLDREWLVFLCRDTRFDLRGTHALSYIRHGERIGVPRRNVTGRDNRWYDLGSQVTPDLILPIAFHERFFVVENDARSQVHQRFATVTVDRAQWVLIPVLAAVLSSSLTVLLAQVLGRHGLGEGALDFPPDDWREILIPDFAQVGPRDRKELAGCWNELAAHVPVAFACAARDPVQQRLDGIVARLIGRDDRFMESVRHDALALIESRLAKARARIIGEPGT